MTGCLGECGSGRWHRWWTRKTSLPILRLIKRFGSQHPLGYCSQIRSIGAPNPRRDRRGQLAIASGELFEHDFHTALRYALSLAFGLSGPFMSE
jgi:hypothetical protein